MWANRFDCIILLNLCISVNVAFLQRDFYCGKSNITHLSSDIYKLFYAGCNSSAKYVFRYKNYIYKIKLKTLSLIRTYHVKLFVTWKFVLHDKVFVKLNCEFVVNSCCFSCREKKIKSVLEWGVLGSLEKSLLFFVVIYFKYSLIKQKLLNTPKKIFIEYQVWEQEGGWNIVLKCFMSSMMSRFPKLFGIKSTFIYIT